MIKSSHGDSPALAQWPARLRGGGAASELHPCRSRAQRDADGDQPSDPPPRGAARHPPLRTAQGYLPAVRAAFEDLRQATDRLRRGERDGLLTVSTTPSLAAKWLVQRVAAFQDAHPGIEIRISASTQLVDFGREAEIDMAVRYGRGSWPGLRADWLMAEEFFPVCSPVLRDGDKPLRNPADLAR